MVENVFWNRFIPPHGTEHVIGQPSLETSEEVQKEHESDN